MIVFIGIIVVGLIYVGLIAWDIHDSDKGDEE